MTNRSGIVKGVKHLSLSDILFLQSEWTANVPPQKIWSFSMKSLQTFHTSSDLSFKHLIWVTIYFSTNCQASYGRFIMPAWWVRCIPWSERGTDISFPIRWFMIIFLEPAYMSISSFCILSRLFSVILKLDPHCQYLSNIYGVRLVRSLYCPVVLSVLSMQSFSFDLLIHYFINTYFALRVFLFFDSCILQWLRFYKNIFLPCIP